MAKAEATHKHGANLHRVVVTGMGVVSSLGQNIETFWHNLNAGKSGISPIVGWDTADYLTTIAGQVHDFALTESINHRDARRMARFTQFAVTAAESALAQAGIDPHRLADPFRLGVTLGCGIGGIDVVEEQHARLQEKGPRRVSPLFIPMFIPNMAAGQVAIHLNAKGPSTCPVTACASAAHAIGDAFRVLQRGEADFMITGGTEAAISPLSIAGFISAKTLSKRNSDPEAASRPFDRERDGFVMGEGAGVLILETLESALSRGATIYAEMKGYGMSNDAHHITAPDPEGKGLIKAMSQALCDAQYPETAVGYINAHGTSTPLNDVTETRAIKQLFREHAYALKISSTKSMTGHLLGAAGGIEAIATVMGLYTQRLHPTRNLDYPDPDCDLDYIPHTAIDWTFEVGMSNSMGFGGHNASLIFARYPASHAEAL